MNNTGEDYGRILVTVALAMALRIAPWLDVIMPYNPDWVLLVLIYWSLAAPERVGIFHAWLWGLLTDVLTGSLLGQYALAYTLVIYLCLKFHHRLRHFPLIQQGLFVFFCLLLAQLLLFFSKNTPTQTQLHGSFWLPVFSGAVLWPLLDTVLRRVRLSKRIY
jgi:rod shape-determining protein MreD